MMNLKFITLSVLFIGSAICNPIGKQRIAFFGDVITNGSLASVGGNGDVIDNSGDNNTIQRTPQKRIAINGNVQANGPVASVGGDGSVIDNSGNGNTITQSDGPIRARISIGGNAILNGSLASVGGDGTILDNAGNGNAVITGKDIILLPVPGIVHNGDVTVGSSIASGNAGSSNVIDQGGCNCGN